MYRFILISLLLTASSCRKISSLESEDKAHSHSEHLHHDHSHDEHSHHEHRHNMEDLHDVAHFHEDMKPIEVMERSEDISQHIMENSENVAKMQDNNNDDLDAAIEDSIFDSSEAVQDLHRSENIHEDMIGSHSELIPDVVLAKNVPNQDISEDLERTLAIDIEQPIEVLSEKQIEHRHNMEDLQDVAHIHDDMKSIEVMVRNEDISQHIMENIVNVAKMQDNDNDDLDAAIEDSIFDSSEAVQDLHRSENLHEDMIGSQSELIPDVVLTENVPIQDISGDLERTLAIDIEQPNEVLSEKQIDTVNDENKRDIWYFGPIIPEQKDTDGKIAALRVNLKDIPTPEDVLATINQSLKDQLTQMQDSIQILINRLQELQVAFKPDGL